ncbi:MAG: glutamate-5-semialdehyde dehydrogenase [Candidatus Binatus sp.]|jgi:glutamate-5-semialdehyde dehydrogenase|uniref:glutamate-5-semialdehyde dehydrogenase n=1 Tax=Candidatus Binatus sp. TaxID=2811406 RepID=UPI003D13F3E2
MTVEADTTAALARARAAAPGMALATTAAKNDFLRRLASSIRDSRAEIIRGNAIDLERARNSGRGGAFVERLTLNDKRIEAMAAGVLQVEALADPVGAAIEKWTRPNGLKIEKRRVPIGVIAMIYESRPNVTVDAAALTLKAGNAVVLRGGSEALSTNGFLAGLISHALRGAGLNPDAATFIRDPDREVIQIMKRSRELIDLIIPRGGRSLKDALDGSAVPLLPHFDGICHTYVDRAADLKMAEEICVNAKCSRPSVCNSMEKLLVHREVAEKFLPSLAARMMAAGVELRGDHATRKIVPAVRAATDEDWDAEYLDLILAVKVVASLDEAIEFIARHGSHLADAIVTSDVAAAARFEREVDSATVYVNASTRFTDGFEFGFGAETGISTNRLHARGPMGLNELTTYKYVVGGTGQIRA